MNFKFYAAASAVLTVISGVNAGSGVKRTGPPTQPSCVDFTPFVYAGCFKDNGGPRSLLYHSNLDFKTMTVEKCVAFCKGNDYKYAGLEYYGQCYCGASVNGPQIDESNCNFPCNGNKNESCGGNSIISVYQDPTFLVVDQTSISDYMPMGCYSEGPNGRTLAWRQTELTQSALTVETCLFACKRGGYAFAGVEFGRECYCGVVLGNGTLPLNSSECSMRCTGDSSEYCGGRSTLNLYVATDLESTEPCDPGDPGSSSSTSDQPSTSSALPTISRILSSDPTTTLSSSSLSSHGATSSPSTPVSSSSNSSSIILSSSTSSKPTSSRISSDLSTKPPTGPSSSTLRSSSPGLSSSIPSSSTASNPSESSFSGLFSSSSGTTIPSSLSYTSPSSISTTPSYISSPPPQSSSPSSGSSAVTSYTSSLGSRSSSTPSLTSITSSSISSSSSAPSSPPLSSFSSSSSSSSSTTSGNASSSTTASLCTSTITIYPSPTCEYKCGKWCTSPIPQFNDRISCLKSVAACAIQLSSCFKNAGFPDSVQCDQFDEWCSHIGDYCDSACPGPNCSLSACKKVFPPPDQIQGTPTFLTSVHTCPITSDPSKPSTTSIPFSTVPLPTNSNICTQPNNPTNGYDSNAPVGAISLPYLACSNEHSDYDAGRPFKLYISSDFSECPSYQRSGDYGPLRGCRDACDTQYLRCVGTYAESYRYKKGREKRAGGDDYPSAYRKCRNQRDDCYSANKGVSGGGRCGSF